MKRTFITTGDGSVTIHLPDWDEQYHSKHGAIAEAQHVFLNTGLAYYLSLYPKTTPLKILEIGFGTGLNGYLTLLSGEDKQLPIHYTGVEAYPISEEEIAAVNYAEILKTSPLLFNKLHEASWEEQVSITEYFRVSKRQQLFKDITDTNAFHLIYFDAFGARVQPELWTEAIFSKMYTALMPNGVLVTYAAKGSVRRAMQAVGFKVERLPGPPGKREMLRATKEG